MSTSPDLGLPYVASQQAQPEVTHNEGLTLLQALHMGVISTGQVTPPVSPTVGDCYLLDGSPTGAWAGRPNRVAIYTAGGWRFVPDRDSSGTVITMGTRQAGMRVNTRAGTVYLWTGSAWIDASTASTVVNAYISGVLTGCTYTATPGGTTFSVAAGTLRIVDDYTTPGSYVVNFVTFAGAAGVADSFPSSPATYVGINSAGTVVQQATPFTADDQRAVASVAVIAKSAGLITASAPLLTTAYNADWFAHDLQRALGTIVNGCRYSGISGLQLARTSGSVFRPGANYATSKKVPNEVALAAQSPVSFAVYSRNNSNTVWSASGVLTTLDPTKYDDGGPSTAGVPTGTVSTNNWQAMRVYLSPGGASLIQYGTATYTSAEAARAGVGNEAFYPAPLTGLTAFRGYLLVRGGAANLSLAADCVFVDAGKLGDTSVALSGGAVAPNPVVFAARGTAATQSISAGVDTKVNLPTEDFDTASCFDSTTNYRFTPTVAGYYQFNGTVRFGTSSGAAYARAYIFKNGAAALRGDDIFRSNAATAASVSGVLFMNGTTDYVELYGTTDGSTPTFENPSASRAGSCWLDGHVI